MLWSTVKQTDLEPTASYSSGWPALGWKGTAEPRDGQYALSTFPGAARFGASQVWRWGWGRAALRVSAAHQEMTVPQTTEGPQGITSLLFLGPLVERPTRHAHRFKIIQIVNIQNNTEAQQHQVTQNFLEEEEVRCHL